MSDRDIVSEIDALIDEQLEAGEPGYVPQREVCRYCGRPWHGLKITVRMEAMLWYGYDETYKYNEDDSEIICPGGYSDMSLAEYARLLDHRLVAARLEMYRKYATWDGLRDELAQHNDSVGLLQVIPTTWGDPVEGVPPRPRRSWSKKQAVAANRAWAAYVEDCERIRQNAEHQREETWRAINLGVIAPDPPQPSTTPPMWAVDPSRSRRRR